MTTMREESIPSSLDSDSRTVDSLGEALSGKVPIQFDIQGSALDLTADVPSGTEWIVGVPSSYDVTTSLLIALYADGMAVYVAPCAFELYTAPVLELAASEGVLPADVWRTIAEGDNAAVLDKLRAQELSTSQPEPWDELAANERSLDTSLVVPSDAVAGSEPFVINVRIPESLIESDGFACIFTEVAWTGCTDLGVAGDGYPLDLRGVADPKAQLSLGIFASGSELTTPSRTFDVARLSDLSVTDGVRSGNFSIEGVGAASGDLRIDAQAALVKLPDDAENLQNVALPSQGAAPPPSVSPLVSPSAEPSE